VLSLGSTLHQVVSSAVYRYFASRDELLTALIVDAFDSVGAVAEEAAADPSGGAAERWARVATAVRRWAIENPAEYGLVYGTPVPGYQAPEDTVAPAARVTLVALRIVADGLAAGEIQATPARPVRRAVHRDFANIRSMTGLDLPDEVLGRALLVWTQLFGAISYELYGHLHRAIDDYDAFFEHQLARSSAILLGASPDA
jgi:AcrR family transcriptional regulator